MQNRYAVLLISIFALFVISCKNDKKSTDSETVTGIKTEKSEKQIPEKKARTAADMDRSNSVMARLMVTPETKKYTNLVVTAGLSDLLSDQKGPFTIFAPSNASFDSLNVEIKKLYYNPDNKEDLINLIKAHIVEGNIDSATMVQEINKKGSLKLKTLAGGILIATKKGMDIVIADGKGGKAIIQKSDIHGSNGVVHVLNAILNLKEMSDKK